jgi:hypothetical protein
MYPDLTVRLKKVRGFIRFSLFFALKTAVYVAFSHRVENVARSVHREVPELAQNTVFCNRMTVFFVTANPVLFNRRTASLYRIYTATKL